MRSVQLYLSAHEKKILEFCPGKLIILSTFADTVYPFSADLHTVQTMFQNNLTFKSKPPPVTDRLTDRVHLE